MENEKIYYVYALCDPRKPYASSLPNVTHRPFYIGKGKDTRMFYHLYENETNTDNPHKHRTIKQIERDGYKVQCVKLYTDLLEDDAYQIEDSITEQLGRRINGGILTNIVVGARCPSQLPEVRKKISEANKGRKQTKQHIAARVAKNIGKKRTEEQKQRIREATMGLKRKNTDNIRRAAQNRSPEHQQALKKALTGRKLTAQHKENIRQAQLGKPKPKSACPHCGTVCAHNMLKRFHLDNCKQKR